jgi:hypothetical protein
LPIAAGLPLLEVHVGRPAGVQHNLLAAQTHLFNEGRCGSDMHLLEGGSA